MTSIGTMEITCPSCGTVSHFEELGRDAGAFCRVCDYPLFWARPLRAEAGDGSSGDEGLRRLPGTAGRVALATIDCPACTEPNPVSAAICIRCGADLYPAPPTVVLPPPPPEPVPEPEPVGAARRVIWPWIVLALLALAAVVILIALEWS